MRLLLEHIRDTVSSAARFETVAPYWPCRIERRFQTSNRFSRVSNLKRAYGGSAAAIACGRVAKTRRQASKYASQQVVKALYQTVPQSPYPPLTFTRGTDAVMNMSARMETANSLPAPGSDSLQ
jgi:hypothetical protein